MTAVRVLFDNYSWINLLGSDIFVNADPEFLLRTELSKYLGDSTIYFIIDPFWILKMKYEY